MATVGIFRRIFGGVDDRAALRPLYAAIVTAARQRRWYADGGVPDTLDGRFEMVAAILALVLLRLEREDAAGRAPAALLTEIFVEDMDSQLREAGIGDMVVGKHVGRMMSALGGRLTAYRESFAPGGDVDAALVRNLYRGTPPAPAALERVHGALVGFVRSLAETRADALLAGRLPTP